METPFEQTAFPYEMPEAVALGGLVATGSPAAPLLTLLVSLQNLPEGFNAYREITAFTESDSKKTLLTLMALVVIGLIAGFLDRRVISGLTPLSGFSSS